MSSCEYWRFAAGCLWWRMSPVRESFEVNCKRVNFSSSISRRSLQLTPLSHICFSSISSPSASEKLRALLTSRPSLVKRDWLDYLRPTGKSCSLFWTKTRADTSRRRSSSKESRHDFMFLQQSMAASGWQNELCTLQTFPPEFLLWREGTDCGRDQGSDGCWR